MASFGDVLPFLKEGYKIKRVFWEDFRYWYLDGMELMIHYSPKDDPVSLNDICISHVLDYFADTDWCVCDESLYKNMVKNIREFNNLTNDEIVDILKNGSSFYDVMTYNTNTPRVPV